MYKSSQDTADQEQTNLSETFPHKSEIKDYDRLAGDEPGEELQADATVWKNYMSEAQVQDKELVERDHSNIDVMLVFVRDFIIQPLHKTDRVKTSIQAAIFSAILTTFLLDSKSMMRPDPSDATNLLLMRIAQRLENPNSPSQSVDIPVFEPTFAARWINALWFTALGLCLAASLLAMLAKEWLQSFKSYRPHAAYAFAMNRQARLDALSSWGALRIIDLLPLFLHIALLLFSLGLIVYLRSEVDSTVEIIIAAITGVTVLFYLVTTIMATFWEVCPFDTQLSFRLRKVVVFVVDHCGCLGPFKHYFAIPDFKPSKKTTEDELQALQWLADQSRDPKLGDSAYQALAGLSLPSIDTSVAESSGVDQKISKRQDKLITTMFVDICNRLNQAHIDCPHDMAASFGTNVARYVSALPRIIGYMLQHGDPDLLNQFGQTRRNKIDEHSGEKIKVNIDETEFQK